MVWSWQAWTEDRSMIYYIELLINNVLVNLMSMYIKIEYDISLS